MGAKKEKKDAAAAKASEGNAEPEVQGTLLTFFRLFTFAQPFDTVLLCISLASSIGAGVAFPVMFVVLARIINSFTDFNAGVNQDSLRSDNSENVLYIVYIFIAKLVLSYVSIFTVRITGLRLSAAIRLTFLRALFKQPLSSMDKLSTGKVAYRITAAANTIQLGISQQLALFVQSIAFILGFFIVAFVYDALITVVACSVLVVTAIFMGVSLPPLIKIGKFQEEYREEASALTNEVFTSIRVVAAYGAESLLAKRHAMWVDKITGTLVQSSPYVGLWLAPTLFAIYGTSALAFYFGIRQYVDGNVDGGVGSLVLVYLAVTTATTSFNKLGIPGLAISQAATAAAEMFATIDAEAPETGGAKEPEVSAAANLVFEDVHFAYPARPDMKILNGLDMTLEAGKTTAIVGPSGSGKSTIVGLVERWYNLNSKAMIASADTEKTLTPGSGDLAPTLAKDTTKEGDSEPLADISLVKEAAASGTIRIGEHDLQNVDLAWWRAKIGFVQQEPFLFNDTIFRNVMFGLCGTEHFTADEATQRTMVEDACRKAHAHDFIVNMSEGYDTVVGESGLKLSGGQRQRIAIARSIVKNPPILILDEATSALDINSEKVVQKALEEVAVGRTTIVIAHRLSTIKKADKIVVLRGGKLIEEGTHESLIAIEDGFYAGLVRAQELSLGDDGYGKDDEVTEKDVEISETNEKHPLGRETSSTRLDLTPVTDLESGGAAKTPEKAYKDQGFFGSFGLLLWEQSHRVPLYAIMIVGSVICGATYPLQAWYFAEIINVFALPEAQLVDDGNFWALMLFVLAIVSLIAYFGLSMAAVQLSGTISGHYRKEYFTNLVNKPISFYDEDGNSSGTLTSRIASDPQSMQQLMGAEMALILTSITNIIGSIAISFVFGWELALVGILAVMPVILTAGAMRYKLEREFEIMNAKVFEYSAQFATEAAGAFRTVTAMTLEDTICSKYQVLLETQAQTTIKKSIWGTIVFAFSDSVDLACNALVFWYGGRLIADGTYDVLAFFVIYLASLQSAQAAAAWFAFAPNMANAASASNRIISTRETKTIDPASQGLLPPSTAGAHIKFNNVRFTYPTRSEPVLKGCNIEILPGQFAALVGSSGCGKSTIISLLERFYVPDSGTVSIDDQNINTLEMSNYRANLALVAQEPTLYEGTIRENITLSVGEVEVSDEEVHEAAREAYIHEFIASLPEGYATRLGPKGVSLSGGQKQRISVARALLRKPRLLLLDEATSSLDPESERQVQGAIERAAEGGKRTVLAVAHRLATVMKADVIFVLGVGGKVVERGSHAELVRKRGVYFQMCQAQSLDK